MGSSGFVGRPTNSTRRAFFAFMKMLRRASMASGRRVVVIADNAKYHHARLHKHWRRSR
jgi:hypothetical protein